MSGYVNKLTYKVQYKVHRRCLLIYFLENRWKYWIHFWTHQWKKNADKIEVIHNGTEGAVGPRKHQLKNLDSVNWRREYWGGKHRWWETPTQPSCSRAGLIPHSKRQSTWCMVRVSEGISRRPVTVKMSCLAKYWLLSYTDWLIDLHLTLCPK